MAHSQVRARGVRGADDLTGALAAFTARTRFPDLPPRVRRATVSLIIDSIGCALAGPYVDKGRIAVDFADAQGAAARCTVLGTRVRTSGLLASFANGELVNALDFDAILAPGHITPYVIPPALALAEERGATGAQLIAAVALGHEIGCRVAASLAGLRELRGRPPRLRYALSPVSGYGSSIFGAAAGAAAILDLNAEATANAFGIAGYAAPVPSLTKYLHARHSFHTKYTSPGWVAMGGYMAADLSLRQYGGDETILDGPHGFWRMFGSKTLNREFLAGGLGAEWRMLRVELKPYPSFRMSHAAVDALRELIRRESLSPDEISAVAVSADPVSTSECYVNRRLSNHTDAQLSWPFIIAAAAYYTPGLAWQREALQDTRVLRLMERVQIRPNRQWAKELYRSSGGSVEKEFPTWLRSAVTVTAKGRRTELQLSEHTKGTPENPVTDRECDEKFLHNAGESLGPKRSREALDMLRDLEHAHDIRQLIAALTP